MDANFEYEATLPAARTLTFALRGAVGELSGDDKLGGVAYIASGLEWSLEAGGISLAAWQILTGRNVLASGTTPARLLQMTMLGGACYPYLSIFGRAVDHDCESDLHVRIFVAKVTKLEGKLGYGEFFLTQCSGIAVAHNNPEKGIVMFRQYEAGHAIPHACDSVAV